MPFPEAYPYWKKLQCVAKKTYLLHWTSLLHVCAISRIEPGTCGRLKLVCASKSRSNQRTTQMLDKSAPDDDDMMDCCFPSGNCDFPIPWQRQALVIRADQLAQAQRGPGVQVVASGALRVGRAWGCAARMGAEWLLPTSLPRPYVQSQSLTTVLLHPITKQYSAGSRGAVLTFVQLASNNTFGLERAVPYDTPLSQAGTARMAFSGSQGKKTHAAVHYGLYPFVPRFSIGLVMDPRRISMTFCGTMATLIVHVQDVS